MRVEELTVFFREIQDDQVQHLSLAARKQYDLKRPYLSDGKIIQKTWNQILFFFEKNNTSPAGKKILDVGCGTGYISIYFAAAGAEKVVGVDLNASRIETFHTFLSFLPASLREKIQIIEDRIEKLDSGEEFDIIVCNEAISHIVTENLFFLLYDFLKRDGSLFISDGNNELCRSYRKSMFEFWNRVENGPPGEFINRFKNRTIDRTYSQIRCDLIEKWHKRNLTPEEITSMAARTAYLYGTELKKKVDQYIESGKMPDSRYVYGTPPVDPQSGTYWEKLFNPYQLRNRLRMIGFRLCHLYSGTGILSGNLFRRTLARFIPLRIKYLFRRSFIIVAQK